MKVKELTEAINELDDAIETNDSLCVQDLRNLVKELDPESVVVMHTLQGVARILNEFWATVYQSMEDTFLTTPWINFQNNLKKLGFENVDHPQQYQLLAAEFATSNNGVELVKLMPLLTRIARLLGYAEQKSLNEYPFGKLSKEIVDRKSIAHEQKKYRTLVTMLGTLFIVLHSHCTAEQLKLLPRLCDVRFMTTDEERRSEKAILGCLIEWVLLSRSFFDGHEEYIDARELKLTQEIKDLEPLLPNKRNLFVQNLLATPWEKILVKQMENDTQEVMAQRLLDDFSALADHSHEAAAILSSAIKRQIATLPKEQVTYIHTVLYNFSLNAYSNDRDKKLYPSGFFTFSKDTKCSAATKKAKSLMGQESSLGLFEFFALKQGRLGRLVETFEEENSVLMN
ncbi:hypothetical protein [Legionella brunensis]|uniref:Uncharacterized protein n=1 Tax=Legionella brunensis TaxID=29422 RepID=A0A0W0SU04_9GAMM|nr:hypothetical protein [Legionella brunensis]KTC86850.1 hypothetical protein Lbru_0079 [Legionella brunensis]